MGRVPLWRRRAVAAALLCLTPSAALADVLVLRSSGPTATQYRAGSRIADGVRVRLQGGDRLLVLDGRSTRSIFGPATYVAGSRRLASVDLVRSWRQRVRARTASVRAPTPAEAQSRALLVSRAMEAAQAGRYAESEALLAQVEAFRFHQKVQCRLVRNQRLYNLVAQGRAAEALRLPDACADLRVPAALRSELAALEQDAADMVATARTMQEQPWPL